MPNRISSKTAAARAPGAAGWRELCQSLRVSPDEVRLVFERYDAYRHFRGGAADIGLDQWFGFYHMEKSSEGQQAGPSPSGCSVDSDAVNNACIERPAEFLRVLKAYVAESGN